MRLAVILVHYHSPGLVAEAVSALQSDLAGSGIETEWLVVDNGSDEAEQDQLDSLGLRRIDSGANLGYAGGVNLGVACSTAETMIVMNPDVFVLPGCVPALLDRLRSGAAVVGPAFFWDRGRRMLLPPAEPRGRRDELLASLAARDERWAARARRRWRTQARRHWEAQSALESHALSGSLLAIRRDAWKRVGPFDEGFRLFFEETDWLLRARRLGLRSEYVPAAEAVHLYHQSAAREPRAQQWFAESARRFRRLHYGGWFTSMLEAMDRRMPERARPALPAVLDEGLDLAREADFPLWVEVSPNRTGCPAAAERIAGPAPSWKLPDEIAARLSGQTWLVQVSDRQGREILRSVLTPSSERSTAWEVA